MYKIAIISKNAKLLKSALEFNLDGKFEFHTYEFQKNLSGDNLKHFDLAITDDIRCSKFAQVFDSPIDLSVIIRFIDKKYYNSFENGMPLVDIKSRILTYKGQKVELTQQGADILQILISAHNFKVSITDFAKKLGMRNINFEAIKTGAYRVNQRFVEYDIPLKIFLNSEYILLEIL